MFANAGTLSISFFESYTPVAGDTFEIVHSNAIVGDATNVDLAPISNLLFEVNVDGGTVTVAFANAGDDTVLTNVSDGAAFSIPVAALLANDFLLDGDALSIQSVGAASGSDQGSWDGGDMARRSAAAASPTPSWTSMAVATPRL